MKMLLIALSLLVPISVSCAAADELAKSERFQRQAQNTCTAAVGTACADAQTRCGNSCRSRDPNDRVCLKQCCLAWSSCLSQHFCDTSIINCNFP